jgi:hypothetical protein
MKKNLLFILSILSGSLCFAQCTILGNDMVRQGSRASFSVSATAQCDDCYTWKTTGFQIMDNKMSNTLSVLATEAGSAKISVTILTATGTKECEKTVSVESVKGDSVAIAKDSLSAIPCKIPIKDFLDVKVGTNMISFFPDVNSSDYDYKWTIVYNTGEIKVSDDKIPQFPFSEIMFPATVRLQSFSRYPICSQILNKTYPQEYWIPKKPVIIEQRRYEQGNFDKTKPSVPAKNNAKK